MKNAVRVQSVTRLLSVLMLAAIGGCASGDQGTDEGGLSSTAGAGVLPQAGAAGINGAAAAASAPTAGTAGASSLPQAGMLAPAGMGAAGIEPPPSAGTTAPLPQAGTGLLPDPNAMAGMGAPPMNLPPPGPDDGDPNAPIIEAPGVACGPNASLFGLTSTNVMIGGRAVHVAYPCNKHKGAPATFVLQLHGTMPTEDLKLYQVAYFAVNNHVNTHNLITAAPKAIGSQWGNGDGGADLPHILEVIDWVYSTFADFDIRGMWISGHSWGAMYTSTFACSLEVADKIRGVVLESGTGQNPACAGGMSVISSAAENDIGPVVGQGLVPSTHGCGAEQTNMLGNNIETYWPDCDPGFVHANYLMLGKGHADYMDAEVVLRIADLIKLSRQ